MKGVYNFVVTPVKSRYNNKKSVNGRELILNTEIFNHRQVSREAIVKSIPTVGDTDIQVGDTVIIHHNVFRKWHDQQGVERNSKSYFNENTYLVNSDQIFLYKNKSKWKPQKGFCFVAPIKSTNKLSLNKEQPLIGIVKYTDGTVKEGDLVGFTPNSEYEFIIEGKKLYRVYSKFITIKYEYQGNEEEYNPSWAESSGGVD